MIKKEKKKKKKKKRPSAKVANVTVIEIILFVCCNQKIWDGWSTFSSNWFKHGFQSQQMKLQKHQFRHLWGEKERKKKKKEKKKKAKER